ncbi:MAG: hypothetical protein ACJ8GN_02480 [Longimicrobiaceae bacterium]
MRRIFALLLVTPLLANCSDSTTPVAPSGAVRSVADAPTEETWPAEENWWTPGDVLADFAAEASPLQAAPAPGAVMVFGSPDHGSNFPGPAGTHDESYHAKDRIHPGSVVIDAGQTVTFQIYIGHRVAIYDNGVQPEDIQPTPGPLLLYAPGRVFLQPFPTPQFKLKFVRPGKYLVLCAINKHFFDARMWGWVIVR